MTCLLRVGSCIAFEGDHITRHAGKNATYEVQLRNAGPAGVPILSVSARSGVQHHQGSSGHGATSTSSFSVPLHTGRGSENAISFSATPSECVREAFEALARPIISSVVLGDDPLGTIVVDSAGAPRNRIATGMLDLTLNFAAKHDNVERVHASLVEIDTRGEFIDVLDPASPHAPRIDENFDAQSVHIANATLLDVGRQQTNNRARVVRSVVAGKHSICSVIIRRKDGSLGAMTCVMLQVAGDGLKKNPQTAFRSVLQKVCEGLSSVPMPPSVPFSKSKLTFLLKGCLCQTQPCAWIVALSPWYENTDEKETFADAATVVKSAGVVAMLTDLSTRASSTSPRESSSARRRFHNQQQQRQTSSSRSPTSNSATHHDNDDGRDDMGEVDPAAAVSGQVLLGNHVVVSPESNYGGAGGEQTPPMKTQNPVVNSSGMHSLESSPIPKENAVVPQPTEAPAATAMHSSSSSSRHQSKSRSSGITNNNQQQLVLKQASAEAFRPSTKSTGFSPDFYSMNAAPPPTHANNNRAPSTVSSSSSPPRGGGGSKLNNNQHQLEQHIRQLESAVATLQSQLRYSQNEQQQLKTRNLSMSSHLADADTRAHKCEALLAALQQHGRFSLPSAGSAPRTTPGDQHHQHDHQHQQPTSSGAPHPHHHHHHHHHHQQHRSGSEIMSHGTSYHQHHSATSITNNSNSLNANASESHAYYNHYASSRSNSQQPHHSIRGGGEGGGSSASRLSAPRGPLISPAIELPSSAAQVIPNRSPSHSRSVSQEPVTSTAPTAALVSVPQQYQQQQQLSSYGGMPPTTPPRQHQANIASAAAVNSSNTSSTGGVAPGIWSRAGSAAGMHGSNNGSMQMPSAAQNFPHTTPTRSSTSMPAIINVTDHSNDFVVVGYNFDLSADEEAAVRREIEKRSGGVGVLKN